MVEESSGAEKILIVKAMGNMGASENIVVLRSIIENKSRHDLEVRISAIYAMRRVAKEFKKQVREFKVLTSDYTVVLPSAMITLRCLKL